MTHAEVLWMAKLRAQTQGDCGAIARAFVLYAAVVESVDEYFDRIEEFEPGDEHLVDQAGALLESRITAVRQLIPRDAK